MEDRADWEQATRQQRHFAVAADAELRRRHPEQRFTPLRSAESEPATDVQRAELAMPAGEQVLDMSPWIKDLAAQRRAFADELAKRQSLTIPSEDPDYGDIGQAFLSWSGQDKGRDPAAAQAADPAVRMDTRTRHGPRP